MVVARLLKPRQRWLIQFSLDHMKGTRDEVANTIEGFVNGTGNQWDWDGFTSIRLTDPELETIREKCVSIRDEFPSSDPHRYCSDEGFAVMREIVRDLRAQR